MDTQNKLTKKYHRIKSIGDFLSRHSLKIALLCLALLALINWHEYKDNLVSFDFSGLKLGRFFWAIIFLIIILNLVRSFKRITHTALEKQGTIEIGLRYSIVKIIGYIGWVIAIWGFLSIMGLKTENLAIFIGALSVGIGFGLQNIVNNFMSGLIVLFERPIQKGDWIIIKDKEGIVQDIKIRSTELLTFDKTSVLIPNADILSNDLTNVTRQDKTGRAIIKVSVAYGSDLPLIKKILLGCIKKKKGICKNPAPYVLLTNFGESGINFELRFIVDDVLNRLTIKSDLMFMIYDKFAENNITIPFPQRELRILNSDIKNNNMDSTDKKEPFSSKYKNENKN